MQTGLGFEAKETKSKIETYKTENVSSSPNAVTAKHCTKRTNLDNSRI